MHDDAEAVVIGCVAVVALIGRERNVLLRNLLTVILAVVVAVLLVVAVVVVGHI